MNTGLSVTLGLMRPVLGRRRLFSQSLLGELAKKYKKTQAQVALNWIISKKNAVAIPKSTSKEHLIDNMGSVGWKMDSNDYKLLDKTGHEELRA